MLEARPKLTPQQIKRILIATQRNGVPDVEVESTGLGRRETRGGRLKLRCRCDRIALTTNPHDYEE
jgi:hypothetical protein